MANLGEIVFYGSLTNGNYDDFTVVYAPYSSIIPSNSVVYKALGETTAYVPTNSTSGLAEWYISAILPPGTYDFSIDDQANGVLGKITVQTANASFSGNDTTSEGVF